MLNAITLNGAQLNGAVGGPYRIYSLHEGRYSIPINQPSVETYSFFGLIHRDIQEKSWLLERVVTDISGEPSSIRLSSKSEELSDIKELLKADGQESSRLLVRIGADFLEHYWGGFKVKSDFESSTCLRVGSDSLETASLPEVVTKDTEERTSVLGSLFKQSLEVFNLNKTVTADHTAGADLTPYNPVKTTVKEIYSGYEETSEFIQHVFEVMHRVHGELGADVITLACDEASHSFQAAVELSDARSWMRCQSNDEIEITVNDITVKLLIDDRVRTKEFGQTKYVINARSPVSRMDAPYALPITKEYPATTVRTVCQEFCDDAGVTLDWQITDWSLPENRLSVANETPLGVITKLIKAAGAVIQSGFNGDLIVRYDYPVPITRYGDQSVTVGLVLTDIDDIFNFVDTREFSAGINSVVVSDQNLTSESLVTMEIEAIEGADLRKNLKVFTYPEKVISMSSSRIGVSAIPLGWVSETVTEEVEFVKGVANLSQPGTAIVSVNYLDANLGEAQIDGSALTAATAGFTLAEVTYQRRFQKFRIEAADYVKAQLYTS